WLAERLAPPRGEVRFLPAGPPQDGGGGELLRPGAPPPGFFPLPGGGRGAPRDPPPPGRAPPGFVPPRGPPARAADLRARFTRNPDYAARWAQLPEGARPIANPLGGAPGFAIENVFVLPGLPSEMEAMFDSIAEDFRRGSPIGAWRRVYRTRESE